jgi:tyrosyl-tRNA synthetase
MNVFDTLKERGFIFQTTNEDELRAMLDSERVTCYDGFDPSADSFHIGNLVGIMMLAHIQRAGHQPIALVGGGTGLIGDPSGKSEMRQMLTLERAASNAEALKAQLSRFLEFGDGGALLVNNADWLVSINYIEFLRDVGRYFKVNEMIKAKGYAERLEREQGLSFVEFNYQVLQAYDYLVLNDRYGCKLQVGGADQWGNIIAGVELIRRVRGTPAHALTSPLITTSTGDKMGKSAAGARWLDADRMSPYDFFQFWRNVPDADVERFLALFTFMPMDEVREIGRIEGKSAAEINAAKETLAVAVTTLVHGEGEAQRALAAARENFALGGLSADTPTSEMSRERFAEGLPLADLLVEIGTMPSKKEARRKIEEGGVYLFGEPIADARTRVTLDDFREDQLHVRVGKKTHHRVLLTS